MTLTYLEMRRLINILEADGMFVQGFRDDVKCNCVLIVPKNH
jgi:hypothetical protein